MSSALPPESTPAAAATGMPDLPGLRDVVAYLPGFLWRVVVPVAVILVAATVPVRQPFPLVLVAVPSRHRGMSVQACEFLIDYLKTQAPFWKKEQTPQGAQLVDARVSDDAALQRWGIQASNG